MMTIDTGYIPEDIVQKIKEAAVMSDIVKEEVELSKSGSSLVGDCPFCTGKKKLNVSPSKKIWKCFKCDRGGKDAISFLMELKGYEYKEALHFLADRYNIEIKTEETPKTKKKRQNRKLKFRDAQLKESGISDKYQKYHFSNDKKSTDKYECDRYQSASVDKYWNVIPGDDMVLHYVDLKYNPLTYRNERGKKLPLLRVRWANPSLHKNKDGQPIKYKSPYKSGSHLWLPNYIIKAYQTHAIIETLFICEGEKKADAMCLNGMAAVGVMGIHNFASKNEMPYQFELLIKRCGITNVVFVLDADWQDISTKNIKKSVDQRPRTFFSSVKKFRDYFYSYVNEGIELGIYFAHGKEEIYKGIDDLLMRQFSNKEERLKLAEDFKVAMIDRGGEGEYVNVYNVTTLGEYKLQEYWNIHNRVSFFEQHKEALKTLPFFKYKQLTYRYNKELEEFELSQKLLPREQYWREETWETRDGKEKTRIEFDYSNILEFLRNRGFGLFEVGNENFRFVHLDGKVVKEVSHHYIQRFVLDFTRELEKKPVVELLLRGGKQYLGPDKLAQMYYKQPSFMENEKDCQYLYFKNCYWKITADGVEQRDLKELPKHIWEDKIIDFEPTYIGHSLCETHRKNNKWYINQAPEMRKCDMAMFDLRTSWFSWKNSQQLHTEDGGKQYYITREKPIPETDEEQHLTTRNLVDKMIATGYVMHQYRDWSNMRAVVCMDGEESEIGKSMGGTGKSIWAKKFKYLVPMETLDGKKSKIEDDSHLYEGIDERTAVVLYDDVRVNFNFEFMFSHITTGIKVNPKGEKRFTVLPPKFIITTNHALNGDGNSFERRQFIISFSDYFNGQRTVGDEFGVQFFQEWDNDQWNLFYNWMATCTQAYLKHGTKYSIKRDSNLARRKLRQRIGENFLDWASLIYNGEDGLFLNKRIEKVFACEQYLTQYPTDRKYVNPKRFKEKLLLFANYMGYEINPGFTGKDGRIKSDGKEFLILANDKFNLASCPIIKDANDLHNPLV